MQRLHYLTADIALTADGDTVIELAASTGAVQHPAVIQEVNAVLDWCRQQHPDGHGPLEDGGDWYHDLQVTQEAGGWHSLALTLTARQGLATALLQHFLTDPDSS